MRKQPTNFFPDECFVRKGRLKFQVSKYRLRFDEFNYVPPKKITQLPFLRALYDWKSTSLFFGDDSLN